MAYNALDQLLSASRSGTNPSNETYAYDDQGRRISKTSGGVQTNNLYNGDAIHSQWVSSPSNTPTAVMVHGAGIDEPLMRLSGTTNTPNATARFYMTDGLGSVIGQVDENGTNAQSQRFDAWGSATNATNPSGINTTPPYGFTGREPDGTGLIHYRARNYLPGLGIFTSRDPAGMVDAVSPYAYVGNRPTMYGDPRGLYAVGLSGMGGGASKGASTSLSTISLQPPTQQSLSGEATRVDPIQIACAPACVYPVVTGVLAVGAVISSNADQIRASINGIFNWVNNNVLTSSDANAGKTKTGDQDPSAPNGRKGNPIEISPGTNAPTNIGGRDFSGHAIDRMQGRGVPPSAVEESIKNGRQEQGNTPGTTVHIGPNGVTVVTGPGGRVITVY
jgi:RHS repeat-associated protein